MHFILKPYHKKKEATEDMAHPGQGAGSELPPLAGTDGASEYVYWLHSDTARRTYVGKTPTPHHRLRQHNGFLYSATRSTKAFRPWAMWFLLDGRMSRSFVLSLEWAMHHYKRPPRRNRYQHLWARSAAAAATTKSPRFRGPVAGQKRSHATVASGSRSAKRVCRRASGAPPSSQPLPEWMPPVQIGPMGQRIAAMRDVLQRPKFAKRSYVLHVMPRAVQWCHTHRLSLSDLLPAHVSVRLHSSLPPYPLDRPLRAPYRPTPPLPPPVVYIDLTGSSEDEGDMRE